MELEIALIAVILTIFTLLWIWNWRAFTFWDNCGVETPPFSYIWGHARTSFFQGPSFADRVRLMYTYFNSRNMKHGGLYVLHYPWYITMDLDIIKTILTTDFRHFSDRMGNEIPGEPLTSHMLNLKGQKWKIRRRKVSPIFSPVKLKMMFGSVLECIQSLVEVMDGLEDTEVNIKDVLGRYTIDVIGSCAFGLECKTLENPSSEFRVKGNLVFEKPSNFLTTIHDQLFIYFPTFMRYINMRFTKREIEEFFVGVSKETIAYREKHNIKRNDLLDIFIQLKSKKKDDEVDSTDQKVLEEMSMEEIAGEVFLFFESGFETSAATMAFCLYEMSRNKDIQEKLRQEITSVLEKYDGKISYDAIMDMPYLDMVVQETLRKYPALPAFMRECTERYTVPGTSIVLEEGTKVLIPVLGIHNDPRYYPDPEKFDPERFSNENKKSRHPFAYIPFGEGPRICIGMRFASMNTKAAIVSLLRKYEFDMCDKTNSPLKWNSKHFIMTAEGNIWLRHRKIVEN